MRTFEEIEKNIRFHVIQKVEGVGFIGYLEHPKYKKGQMLICFSCDRGWEHASVSLRTRCPTWDEMCMIKNIFWGEEEAVMQIHPPASEYVNIHPYCLHLWKPIGIEFPRPDKMLVV